MAGFGFWTPALLAGAALAILPWLIHRIRRPERDTVEFGSLMFIPERRQEIIERRRVQHPWLMAIRIALLLLLALAFARPYLHAEPDPVEAAERNHLILVDLSLSTSGALPEIRHRVRQIVADIPARHRVGLAAFASDVEVLTPLEGSPGAGTPDAVLSAAERLEPSLDQTDFLAGLTFAERMLLESAGGDTTVAATLHLVSDFQESALPEHLGGWRLSSRVRFRAHEMPPPGANLAVTEAVVSRPPEGPGRLRVRVRNGGELEASATVSAVFDGNTVASEPVTVGPGGAAQVAFDVDLANDAVTTGRVSLPADAIPGDNVRTFAWTPPARPVVVLDTTDPGARAAVRAALPADAYDLRNDGAPLANAVLVTDRVTRDALSHVEAGGALLLAPGERLPAEALNRLAGATGVRLSRLASARSVAWGRVDLDHPVFAPFRAPRFNDFSAIRSASPWRLDLEASPGMRSLAWFDDDRPAIVQADVGEGSVVIWLGGLAPALTNLTRSPRFVPLLTETVRHLRGTERTVAGLQVGDRLRRQATLLTMSGTRINIVASDRLPEPGWLLDDAGRYLPVNVDPAESDPAVIPPTEFELRLCNAPGDETAATAVPLPGERTPRVEHGFILILLAAALLAAENVVAARLAT